MRKDSLMPAALQTAPDTAQLTAASALQKLLPELVALSLHAKQVHWNVTGDQFVALHAFTDQVAADARTWADRVAERALALGFTVDARPGTVASAAGPFPAGRLGDGEAVGELVATIDGVVGTTRAALAELDDADPVAHDVIVATLEGLEKSRWMLLAQAG
jgi:starvation-inducible DNA-binding protein